jgi:hypothetical protein
MLEQSENIHICLSTPTTSKDDKKPQENAKTINMLQPSLPNG